MIKYLEVPDFHFSVKYGKIIDELGDKVAEAAKKYEVDFIAVPGDLYDAPIMATDKGGINQLRKIVQKWLDICPVVAVEGTPSHDGPGCYGPLEDAGLKLLKPGKVYGYNCGDNNSIIEINPDLGHMNPDCILFGIPELNKKNIQSRLNLDATAANAEAVTQFNRYVAEFIAVQRLKYENIPAIALMHGNVSDSSKSNENDVILKASDIVLHTEIMEIANIDRWSLGHPHKPWESKNICAGNAGSWGKNWTETGFKPGMNLVEIVDGKLIDDTLRLSSEYSIDEYDNKLMVHKNKNFCIKITSIPYGTPERRKIIHPLSERSYDPEIAYLLETENELEIFTKGSVHEWSEIRKKPVKKESARVDPEIIKNIKTLTDLYKLFDPAAPASILKKIDEIQTVITQREIKPVDIQIQYIEVVGAGAFFNDDSVKFDISEIHGINELHGSGNGVGKSSMLAFCSPYPVVIGKDTKSGRPSAIKDFFDKSESKIIKRLLFNGVLHEHLITIKAAHTQNPKVECYLSINNEPQLDKGTFDEMMQKCEELYGPYNDYLLTSFYVQPLQGKTGSSLMSASMVDIRNLVQAIAGIDREKESRFSLDKVKELENKIKDLVSWLSGATEFNADIPELKKEKTDIQTELDLLKDSVESKLEAGKAAKVKLDAATIIKTKSDAEILNKNNDEKRVTVIDNEIITANSSIKNYRVFSDKLEENKNRLAENADILEENLELDKRKTEDYDYSVRMKNLLQELESVRNRLINKFTTDIENNKSAISSYNLNIKSIFNPCIKCGYLDPDTETKIAGLDKSISLTETNITELEKQLAEAVADTDDIDLAKAQIESIDPITEEPEPVLSNTELKDLNSEISEGIKAEASIKMLEENITSMVKEKNDLEAKKYDINESIDNEVTELNTEVDNLRTEYSELNQEKATKETELKNIDEKILKAKEQIALIKTKEDEKSADESALSDWTAIAKNFQPSKIPGFELDMFLGDIDLEASHIIEPYQNARFSFNTVTQTEGKKSTVDKFDIRIHDAETGKEKSFIEFNPGTKAFLNDAFVKALVKQRNTRFQRSYSPIIIDEADEPIHPSMIECFYTIQTEYWKDNKVIIVSHNPASHEFIENTILIDDLKYKELK